MKILLDIIGVLVTLAGGVWFLQGLNVLQGNLMSGQPQWVLIGGLAVVIGIGLLVFANRRSASPRPK